MPDTLIEVETEWGTRPAVSRGSSEVGGARNHGLGLSAFQRDYGILAGGRTFDQSVKRSDISGLSEATVLRLGSGTIRTFEPRLRY
jgi:hypothetical protein